MHPELDLHMILLSDERADWLALAIRSLADQPAALHLIHGVHGDTNAGRIQGWNRGESEFVGCLDPDDYLFPGAAEACLEALATHPDAAGACTRELQIDEHGRTIGETRRPHHFAVYRRRVLAAALPHLRRFRHRAEAIIQAVAEQQGGLIDVPIIGYAWRVHRGGAHLRYSEPTLAGYLSRAF